MESAPLDLNVTNLSTMTTSLILVLKSLFATGTKDYTTKNGTCQSNASLMRDVITEEAG